MAESKVFFYVEYLLVRGAATLVSLLPLRLSYWIAKRIGDFSYFFMIKRRKVALENLSKVFGDVISSERKRQIAKRSFEHIALSITELFMIPRVLKDATKRFMITGTSYLEEAFNKGKGVILVISHIGSWEYLAFLPYLRKYPCSVVVKSLKNNRVDHFLNRFREMILLHPILENNAIEKVFSEIHKNHLVAISIDQWSGKDGVWTHFFGHPTSTTSIPSRIAQKTGCALVPAQCIRIASGCYKIEIKPEIYLSKDPRDWESQTTQELNRLMESQIMEYPEQWTWGHRRWEPKPQGMSDNPRLNITNELKYAF